MEKIYIVHLRQPRNNPDEMRSDPFWEFGSFGRTGCHCKNLLHKKNYSKLDGNRLAFAQNGKEGFKLVLLTPPVKISDLGLVNEAVWNKRYKPFKYSTAPLIVNNRGDSDFQLLFNSIQYKNRNTFVSKFSSSFRSRCYPLDEEIAIEVLKVYNSKYNKSVESDFISNYTDALPFLPLKIDKNRKKTFRELLTKSDKDKKKLKSKCRKC